MEEVKLSKKDFMSDQEVRWCPGCGDYAILSATQMAMSKLGVPKEKYVCVSGIGCSSRFPYYMNTYGLHTIHGRPAAVATGIKLQNPDLKVWLFTGDGDSLSIGGNHFIHLIRRNIDINLVLFNNEIYGLTKGQYSPTSRTGTISKTSLDGSIGRAFVAGSLALGAGSTFFARTIDTDPKFMESVFIEASSHKGTSIVEVLQNCVIFNDKVHDLYANKLTRDDTTIRLVKGEKMIFGKDKDKCLVQKGFGVEVKNISEVNESEILVHDPTNIAMTEILARMIGPELPLALGVIREVPISSYEEEFQESLEAFKDKKGEGKVEDLFYGGDVWEVS